MSGGPNFKKKKKKKKNPRRRKVPAKQVVKKGPSTGPLGKQEERGKSTTCWVRDYRRRFPCPPGAATIKGGPRKRGTIKKACDRATKRPSDGCKKKRRKPLNIHR